ncbi:uncharacterized protein K444DRAFT_608646 [Hyaloscypha bicolor E]|uniref:Uncharacterized protein n=1 Tax=Hyaloscypha bicolor E TaxID=1095630 RepID=A0A2J6TPL5_9HELO|nr:uncharacterized protein K444DRAFT_608646 [Hyaloscypha bicolor E]PMD64966.1 hypothetical protein K444DRAFT_608646 [Hyaloscypha bicolor E]
MRFNKSGCREEGCCSLNCSLIACSRIAYTYGDFAIAFRSTKKDAKQSDKGHRDVGQLANWEFITRGHFHNQQFLRSNQYAKNKKYI